MSEPAFSFPPGFFQRQDESADELFYLAPRRVAHIDAAAIQALSRVYTELLPTDGRLLDLMSSYHTHLAADFTADQVIGLGLNEVEMVENAQLTDHVVHNLNTTPALPFDDGYFDGAMCAVSVQYLTQPVQVFAEVRRVLRPGAPFVISFSNRCFPPKAIAGWLALSDQQRVALVASYYVLSGGWSDVTTRFTVGSADPLFIVWARREGSADG